MKTQGGGDKEPINSHGGWRPGAGRRPAKYPAFLKKFRATEEEQQEFHSLMTGDAREDFLRVLRLLKQAQYDGVLED